MVISDGVLPAVLSACGAGSLPCSWGDRTTGLVLAVSHGGTGDTSVGARGRDRYQETGGMGRTLRGCLCCSHSCTPLISPVRLAMAVLEDFHLQVLPWGIREGKGVFFIHITPEYSREL